MQGVEVLIVLGVTIVAGTALAGRVGIAPPLVLLLAGSVLGFIPGLGEIELPPEVVLVLFLPALLHYESLTTSLREIQANLRAIVLLAVGLVIATAVAVAVIGHALGLSWPMAFVLGAVLAPTDATAVAAVAGRMPRRYLTTLRAESLINDGTALVLYAVAVSALIGETDPTVLGVSGRLVVSYAGGLLIGVLTALVVVAVRRRIRDALLENAVGVLTPFLAFWPAEVAHVSGVVAVVACGLTLSQTGAHTIAARARLQAVAFWRLTAYLLNAALFVLVGLQLRAAITGLTSISPAAALGVGLAVTTVVVATRLGWLYSVPYLVWALDRRPAQRPRRVRARHRFPMAWAGFRGAVSLAAALAIPEQGLDGDPLPGRDLVLVITFTVILATLLVQGSSLPAVVRWARLPEDPTEVTEMRLADRAASEAGLAALPARAAEVHAPEEVVERVRQDYAEHLQLTADPVGSDEPGTLQQGTSADVEKRLRASLLADKRRAVVALRDARRIDDTVLRRTQARLDVEEIRLTENLPED